MRRRSRPLLAIVGTLAACGTPHVEPHAPPSTAATQRLPTDAPSDPVVAWLDKTLVPIRTDAGAPTDDLDPIAPLLEGRRIIAMGEATHGTKEFFDIKRRFLRWLVEKHGVRTFAMELTRATGEKADRYIKTGEGDPRELVRGSYFFMDSVEIIDLLRWMRAHNESAAADQQLSFVGFDVKGTPAEKTIQDKCGDRTGCKIVMRDGFMAAHVLEAAAAYPGRIFVWAHNGHIAHFESKDGWRPMGQHLRDAAGDAYFAIGFEFDRGSFVAPSGGELDAIRTVSLEHLNGRSLSEYALQPAPAEALAHRFVQARTPSYFVSLRDVPPPARAFFDQNRNLQTYGANPPKRARNYERYDAPLDSFFDALIFVAETHGYSFTP